MRILLQALVIIPVSLNLLSFLDLFIKNLIVEHANNVGDKNNGIYGFTTGSGKCNLYGCTTAR